MADKGVLPTTLDKVLLGIKARAMAILDWPSERVIISDPDTMAWHPQADQYLVLWTDTEDTNFPIVQGAGRVDTRMTEKLVSVLRTRTSLDEAASRESWLTDRSDLELGHLTSRHKIYDALCGYQVTDDGTENGNWLVVAPMQLMSGQRPRRGRIDPNDWGESSMMFTFTYVLALDQNYQ